MYHSTVFVNNLSPRVHWRWLWKIFQYHGRVVDVFIPRKRGVKARKFGFFCFENQVAASRAARMLNGASSTPGLSIQVRPKVGSSKTGPLRIESEVVQVQRRSYVQVLNGVNHELQYSEDQEVGKNSEKKVVDDSASLNSHDSDSVSLKSCLGVVDNEALHKLESCLVGLPEIIMKLAP
ncbi:hypothetical protein REPUB_Repub19eG0121300 [Reevesia pubescens]